ncbi:MAG: acetylglucosamine-6-sulfatase, partial [Pedosphaera sp.]|nr:acetylglucosamine-6-sulfatase [Pedosphaera sp.]
PAHYGVRTQTAKLIYYDGLVTESEAHKWEFYDLQEDPQETRNVYDRTHNARLMRQMKHHLRQWRSNLGDVSQKF